jgi:hydroxyproline O-arabinosyltransferase
MLRSALKKAIESVPPPSWVSVGAVWVWCGDKEKCGPAYKQCWLKHLPWVFASKPQTGPKVPWTSGLLEAPPQPASDDPKAFGGQQRRYHTVTTAQGAPTHWQMRVHYYWFKKQQKECRRKYGENCHMGGFTRLLHSGYNDELASEIPTFVASPLPAGGNGYVVR